MEKGTGERKNEGKNRLDLIPTFPVEQLGRVLTEGSLKYADRNWEAGMPWKNVTSSLKRHLLAFEAGEDFDKETGLLHIAHVMCNAMFLTEYYNTYPEGDDRPVKYLKTRKIGLDVDEVLSDFVGAMMDRFPEIPERPIFWNDHLLSEKFIEIKDDIDFWLNISPKKGVLNMPFEPHCYITSRTVPSKVTELWLKMNGLPKAPVYTVGHGKSKVDIAKESGIDIFVDDRYENFVELNNAGICTFLMDAPHNRRYDVGYKRILKLTDL